MYDQNRRPDYFEGWWRKVDWPGVSRSYDALLGNRPRRAE